MASVVGQAHCCSVVIVNTIRTVFSSQRLAALLILLTVTITGAECRACQAKKKNGRRARPLQTNLSAQEIDAEVDKLDDIGLLDEFRSMVGHVCDTRPMGRGVRTVLEVGEKKYHIEVAGPRESQLATFLFLRSNHTQ